MGQKRAEVVVLYDFQDFLSIFHFIHKKALLHEQKRLLSFLKGGIVMSRFLNSRYAELHPYVPGEQPKDRTYIKLNANESSVPPSPAVLEALSVPLINGMGRYEDPHCMDFRKAIAEVYHVTPEQVFVGNGSDEVLGFCFLTFFSGRSKICFPDITYGFYQVYADTFGVDAQVFALKPDFSIDVDAYVRTDRHVILANPNAPTGLCLPVSDIERILRANRDRLVVIDEAYVDYGNESCVPLVEKYPNLIVVQTFSKSRNLAGARLGFAIASKEIIKDMNAIKFAFNPFNLSEMALAAGTAAVKDTAYLEKCVKQIVKTREYTVQTLRSLGFYILESHTNFIFVKHPVLFAGDYYRRLRENGILTRYYDEDRIRDYLRITIGTPEEMDEVLRVTKSILCAVA